MQEIEFYNRLAHSVIDGEKDEAIELARQALDNGLEPLECIEKGLKAGIEEVGRLFEHGEYFLPELIMGAEAMKAALGILEPALLGSQDRKMLGRVLLATVKGDMHEIGKNLVGTMLTASGFQVFDLGVDKSAEEIIDAAVKHDVHMIGVSALLTTTMREQALIIKLLAEEGLHGRIKVIVGGAPVTQNYADSIGADGYAANAISAVALAKHLMG